MNRFFYIYREILKNPDITQRQLSKKLSLSLGLTNKLLSQAIENGNIYKNNSSLFLSDETKALLSRHKVDNAIILAAGFGSRFVPLTFETPKGLLKVKNERMIERQIRQLHEAGIYDITIIVGYLKEKFDYLIDKFGVKLLYNPEYHNKNTLATLYHARHILMNKNTYILSSDNWLSKNIYNTYEQDSWYSCVFMSGETKEWCVDFNRQGQILGVKIGGHDAYAMYGPVFFNSEFSNKFLPILETYYHKSGTENFYWENVLIEELKHKQSSIPPIFINKQDSDTVYEFENLEELRLFDDFYNYNSNNKAMELISSVFNISESDIKNLSCLKSGMTNKSFLFTIHDSSYICRIPGKGTDKLINRKEEAQVYKKIESFDISEEVIYFNPESGYKISKYYENSRNADKNSKQDMYECMQLIKHLHSLNLSVPFEFNLLSNINFYEGLCNETGGILFEDYHKVKADMIKIYNYIESLNRPKTLSHIDSVCDNFLFIKSGSGEKLRLIDWEYSAMSDPLIDIAMCSIYSFYNKEQSDELMEMYFGRQADETERNIVYGFMALGGFLWALWGVYKANLGENFGDYTLKMYRYAKDFYKFISYCL